MNSLTLPVAQILTRHIVAEVGDESITPESLQLTATKDPKFGDYQTSICLRLAKQAKRNPRDLAQNICDRALKDLDGTVTKLECAGPGFINCFLSDSYLESQLESYSLDVDNPTPETVVVDYSSPNVAKDMHIGHIRSTIIGDSIVRLNRFLGHDVIPQNHIGDWGTQFGMLCAYMLDHQQDLPSFDDIDALEKLYRQASALYQTDQGFEQKARHRVVLLHQGDPETVAAWKQILDLSRSTFMRIYQQLDIGMTQEHERGESFYNAMIPNVLEQIQQQFKDPQGATQCVDEDGTLCLYLYDEKGEPLHKNKDGDPLPMIIRKGDGAFLYASTDLAAMFFRIFELKADRIIIETDARQALHFKMLFEVTRRAGWLDREGKAPVQLQHIEHGAILGPDRKPLKTRSGDNVKLADVIQEALKRARKQIETTTLKHYPTMPKAEQEELAQTIGIGALKYADLSQNRSSDYIFDYDKMLALEGNTAPYLQYAYARIQSIFAKFGSPKLENVNLASPYERDLGLHLLRVFECLGSVSQEWRINYLADYLYELATKFSRFYEHCSIKDASSPEQRANRLLLCQKTAKVLKTGLGLMGIKVPNRM